MTKCDFIICEQCGPKMNFSLWIWFVTVTPVSSQIRVAGQSVLELKAACLGSAGVSVCPLVQFTHT